MPAIVGKWMVNTKSVPQDNFLYPDGTKFFYRNGDICVVVVEQKPQVRTLNFLINDGLHYNFNFKKSNWRLSFPYVIFVQSYDFKTVWRRRGTFVAYSNHSVRSLDDMVYYSNLPNINEFSACLGEIFTTGSVAEQVEQSIGYFWQNFFSKEWTRNYNKSPVGDVEKWSQLTENDPLGILKVDWEKAAPLSSLLGLAGLKTTTIYMVMEDLRINEINSAAYEAIREVKEKITVDTDSLDEDFLKEISKEMK
jgi:hypothetical protein